MIAPAKDRKEQRSMGKDGGYSMDGIGIVMQS
jgi:hypothetical protein